MSEVETTTANSEEVLAIVEWEVTENTVSSGDNLTVNIEESAE